MTMEERDTIVGGVYRKVSGGTFGCSTVPCAVPWDRRSSWRVLHRERGNE